MSYCREWYLHNVGDYKTLLEENMAKEIKAKNKVIKKEKKNDLHTTIVNLEIPRGVRVSDYSFNNEVKTFHS